MEPRVESVTDEGTPPAPSVSANVSESSNVPATSSVPESANISAPEDRNVSESASAPVPPAPEEHISTASWAEICDNSLHQFIDGCRWLTLGSLLQLLWVVGNQPMLSLQLLNGSQPGPLWAE